MHTSVSFYLFTSYVKLILFYYYYYFYFILFYFIIIILLLYLIYNYIDSYILFISI